MSDFDELLPAFIEESLQHLQAIEPDLLLLERTGGRAGQGPPDKDTVNRVFRGVHSIKGASGFFGFQNIGRLSHVMENALALLRDGRVALSAPFIDALLQGVDALKTMIEDIAGSEMLDLSQEIAALQRIVAEDPTRGKTVAVARKAPPEGQAPSPAAGPSPADRFEISEADALGFMAEGQHLYAVKIYLSRDLREKAKSPYDFINNMEKIGRFIDSFLDITSVSGLGDCLDNELAFDFLFASRLDAPGVAAALGLPGDRVVEMGMEQLRDHEPATGGEPAAQPLSAPPAERLRQHFQTEEKIRVGVGFLNDLVNLAGELVLGRNQLLQVSMPFVKTTAGLNPVLQHISRVTTEMQEKIMQMRMQPLSLIFDKFQRVVRDLARKHDKEVRLITSGGDVELDKTIIEGLSDPLTHLIRNAVDHGIEPPAERERAGKPRHGTIDLRAHHQGGQVHLSIRDDGRGIDGDFVAAKAMEKGVITQEQAAAMSPRERMRLIFRPGFSTVEKVTDLSGRGVGMDVVMTNIEGLGGTTEIDAAPGQWSAVTLALPLTLAIVSGLLIRARDQAFILPEVDIDELVRVKPDEIARRIDVVQNAWVLRLRETLLPLVDLNRLLGIAGPDDPDADIRKRNQPLRILIIKHGASRFGLLVDAIINTEEIVVKPLPRYLKRLQSFSGVSILGNGKVSLILDVAGIVKKAKIRRLRDLEEREAREAAQRDAVSAETQTLLLFDNNTPERFALPLELISRIEKVAAARIETVKDKRFLQYQGRKLRLVFLEDYLPISRPERSPDDTLGLIVPKQMKHPMGIVFNAVINTVEAEVTLDTASIMAPGLFGSTVLDDRITLLPDMYALFEMAAPEWYATKPVKTADSRRKPRVLLADDTPFFRMVEKEYLTSAGYEVLVAENGAVALEMLEDSEVDAVILDIVMPRMTGWEAIAAIRANERLRHLPVMAVTSLGNEGDLSAMEKGLDAGFDEWELKLEKTRLLDKLAAMIRKKERDRKK